MMIIRPVTWDDKDALLTLASQAGVGFTSLPEDEARLVSRLERTLNTWHKTAPLPEQGYLFVLEDSDTKQVVGVSGIEVAVGLNEPWYSFRLGTLVHASKELNVYTQMPTLFLSNDHTGHAELCTLFLNADYRHSKNGHLLSKSRMMFIANFREEFGDKVFAEMRGVSDENGESPFWESLGRHFFSIDFSQADYLTGIGQKAFIAELMPKHPLYVDFLTPAAREVIGQVHPCTVPARKILESEGFRYANYVDIFDAGPTLEAYVEDLRIVKQSQIRKVVVSDNPISAPQPYLVSNTEYQQFRTTLIHSLPDDEYLYLTPAECDALQVTAGSEVRIASLFAKQPEV